MGPKTGKMCVCEPIIHINGPQILAADDDFTFHTAHKYLFLLKSLQVFLLIDDIYYWEFKMVENTNT